MQLRCSSEITGCRNCQKRGILCRYGTEVDGHLSDQPIQNQQQSSSTLPLQPETMAEENLESHEFNNNPCQSRAGCSDDFHAHQPQVELPENAWQEFFAAFNPASSSSPSAQSNSSGRVSSAAHTAANSRDLLARFCQTNSIERPSITATDFELYFSNHSSLERSLIRTDATTASDTGQPQGSIPSPFNTHASSSSSCSCDGIPLETWEVFITKAFCKRITVEELIQCQQETMLSCEGFVACNNCSSQSQDMLILIDIAAKLLDSLKTQNTQIPDNKRNQDTTADKMKDEWMARMLRLGHLIASLGYLLDDSHWRPHKSLLQSVQMQFTGIMFGW